MKYSLQQIADAVQARLRGDGSIQIRAVASVVSAKQDDLVFVEDEQ
jgi:UDP-3-O-[3-hydroxymyristoyl] glucosamine N-acyltransferase